MDSLYKPPAPTSCALQFIIGPLLLFSSLQFFFDNFLLISYGGFILRQFRQQGSYPMQTKYFC